MKAPGLARLTYVELRKMTDTRAGFWLQLLVVGLTVVAIVALSLTGSDADRTLQTQFEVAVQPSSLLLPIIGILLVSSEWSQRTGMITFSLVPNRMRVMAAKLLAGVVVAVIALAGSLAIAALGAAFSAPDTAGAWSLPGEIFGQTAFVLVTGMLGGIAVGALLLASAPGIVFYFAAPLGFAAFVSLPFLRDTAPWVDSVRSMAPLTEEALSGTEWARVGTTLTLWLLLPLLIGLWRVHRGEIR
jgi:ABC-2 type transport system permease protein